jgi:hypothetical protein
MSKKIGLSSTVLFLAVLGLIGSSASSAIADDKEASAFLGSDAEHLDERYLSTRRSNHV